MTGCVGVTRQTKRTGCWTGRRIVALYQLTLLLTIIGSVWAVTKILGYVKSFEAADDELSLGTPSSQVVYDSIESSTAYRFNQFFFSATSTCTDPKFIFFWGWINDHCEDVVTQDDCMGCADYSITMCRANEELCVQGTEQIDNGLEGDLSKCPYELCRRGVLQFLIEYMK